METIGRRKKVDISTKVEGKIRDDKMIFFVEDRGIGHMNLNTNEYTFDDDFGIEDNKIYQIQVDGVKNEQYVEGCDMGWC